MSVTYATLSENHKDQAVEVLARALMVEPGFSSIVPEESDRLKALRTVMGSMVSAAMRNGAVYVALENNQVLGAAALLAPGKYPLSFVELVRAMLHYLPLRKLGRETVRNLRSFDTNAKHYFPGDCWYLQAFGVSPAAQGKGVGSGLARFMVEQIGAQDCYLETATPANLPFYERVGFEILNPAAQLAPAGGPTHWTMVRRA